MADSEPGIGKKILSFFINESDEPVRQETVTNSTPGPSKPAAAPTVPASTVPNVAGTANVDRKFVEHFVSLLEKANLPGPDYFEYKQALQSMEGLGLGEEKQFQAAWASFKVMGGIKDTTILRTSADQYLAILDKDRASFLKDVEKAIKDRVGALQDEHKKLEDSNAAFTQQIADLQKKIDENKNRLGQISGEVTEQSAKITANKDSFEITYTSFVEQIKSDLSKINQYLQ
jgi:flagellar motility protein MotE (MotC chaperone)